MPHFGQGEWFRVKKIATSSGTLSPRIRVCAEDYRAALDDPAVGKRMRRAVEIAENFDTNLDRTVSDHRGPDGPQ